MKNSVRVACLACVASLALNSGASAQLGGGKGGPMSRTAAQIVACTVDAINDSALTFDCATSGAKATYNVYSTTVFQLGAAGNTFSGLKVGAAVQVTYTDSGTALVADTVTAR